jgi:4-hydroxybenzoate polyprenyltransferase
VRPSLLSDALAIARFHIVLIAVLGAITFGWLMSGRYLVEIAIVVAIDWFLINMFNRITDLAEDERNDVPGTARVARAKGPLTWLGVALFVGSFAATGLSILGPTALLPARAAVQLMGVAYNYPLLPAPSRDGGRVVWRRTRWKEVYAWKNVASALIFVLTCFVYPILTLGGPGTLGWAGTAILAAYFVLFELTYEVFYDLRDLDGDRALGVPTFPVVHGWTGALAIIDALLVGAIVLVAGGVLSGRLGLREALFIAAPILQHVYIRRRLRSVESRPLGARDGLVITHLGSALLATFLVGSALWLRAGLPANVYLSW